LAPYKVNARRYAEKYLNKENILKDFEQELVQLITNKQIQLQPKTA